MRARTVNDVTNALVVVLAFSLPLYRAWVSLAATLILILWFFQPGLKARVAGLGRHPLTLAVGLFLALNLVSLVWSEDPGGGFTYWRKYLYLLLIPAVATSLRPAFGRAALIAYIGATVLAVIMMPIVIIGDVHIRHIHPENPAATMSHLDFSMILAVAGLLILVHLATAATMSRGAMILQVLIFVLVIGGLVLNIGRSGQFAFVATLAVLVPYLLRRRSWLYRFGILIAVAAVLIATYVVVPPFHDRVATAAVELRDAVVDGRVDTNQGKRLAGMVVGLEIVEARPLLGTGIGGNMPEFRRLLETTYPQFRDAVGWFPHFHNQYLQVATELGIVGLLSLMSIFAALFTGRYRSPAFRAAAVAVGCAYLFGFFGDPFLHKQLPLVLFALAAGIISSDDEVFADTSSQSTVDS
jgi:O-antigen ligase